MNTLSIKTIIMLFMAILLSGCTVLWARQTNEANSSSVCPALPSTFKETDLVGTWIASYSINDTDVILLREDGTYNQTYVDPLGGRYESGWQAWWIERRESGYIRLHLEGMRRFGEIDILSQREGGGIDPRLFTAIDYCETEVIEMPDEIVLIVTGSKDDVPRGIILRQTRLAGSEWTWSFQLQEEKGKP